MSAQAREIRKGFNRRAIRGLAILAILATIALVATIRLSWLDEPRAEILGAAGDAAAASQRIAIEAKTYARSSAGAAREAARADLNAAIEAMRAAHARLTLQDSPSAAERNDLAPIQPMLFGSGANFDARARAYLKNAALVAAASPEMLSSGRPPLSALNDAEAAAQYGAYRAIAGALRDDARAAVKRREHMSAAIWLTTIAAIIIEWIFLLRPIGFKVAASVEEIEKAEERTKAAAEAAEAANASKSNFLRVVSHEIRTPMNAVTGISQLLQKTSLPPAVADYVRQLAAASDHLMGLTGNVLDLSQLESGALKLAAAPFRLADELRRCVQIIAPLARDKGIAFAVDIHETAAIDLEGDAGRLRQIVLNLLSNALKFTDRGSISLTCSAVGGGRDHAGFRIKVVDTGIGVSPETLPQIFRSFEQLDSFETRRKGGAGLGLAIVSELVAAMGGSVSVESTPHVGSTFVVALSLPVARKEQAASAGPAGAVGIRRKVLVVEDNIPNQMIAKAFLKAGGFDVTIANNGQEALDAVAGERFDLVLMDINMPVMDGLEATRILRQDPNYRKTPILAFTAHAIDEDQNSLLSAGLDDVLKKPVTEKGLVDRVRLWIANDNPADAA